MARIFAGASGNSSCTPGAPDRSTSSSRWRVAASASVGIAGTGRHRQTVLRLAVGIERQGQCLPLPLIVEEKRRVHLLDDLRHDVFTDAHAGAHDQRGAQSLYVTCAVTEEWQKSKGLRKRDGRRRQPQGVL